MANKLVMGYWDCPSCSTTGIRGDVHSCPNCGRARGEVKFYMKGHTEGHARRESDLADVEYLTEEQEKDASRNSDWYCSFCHSLNPDTAQNCLSCNASRASSEANYFQMHEALAQREAEHAEPQPVKPKKRVRLLPILLIAAVIVGVILFMNANVTRGDYEVAALRWTRSISVQQRRLMEESGWTVPDGGTVTGEHREIHHYDRVLDHYESVPVQRSRRVIDHYETTYTYTDLGNGYYEQVPHEEPVYTTEYYTVTERQPVYRQEPVYQTRYDYSIWRWVNTRTADAAGEGKDAVWPDPGLAEDERESERAAAYLVTIRDIKKGTETDYRLKEEDWLTLNVGERIFITTKRSGSGPYISDEKGEKRMDLLPAR